MSNQNALILRYRGIQLGDECTRWAPIPQAQPAVVTPLFASPIAAVQRPTPGRSFTIEATVYLIRSNMIAASDVIVGWSDLQDDQSGTLQILQYPANGGALELVKSIPNAYLQSIVPEVADSASRARIQPVRLTFVTETQPT
jgi:hypothetical protein